MFRVIFYLLLIIVLISVLRGVIGIVFKAFGLMVSGGSQNPPPKASPASNFPLSGELKKDPACGTYIAAAGSLKETVAGETFYFCSKQCRDKYVASFTH